MKKMAWVLSFLTAVLLTVTAQARLNNSQAIKCIEKDASTASSFHDLETAYEMQMINTKEFLKILKSPTSCPALKNSVKTLHATMMAKIPDPATLPESFSDGDSTDAAASAAGGMMAPPAPTSEFHDEFDKPAF